MGINLERSTEMVVALLGVLRAGAAYAPWTRLPGGALAHMLADSGTALLLTQEPGATLPEFGGETVVVDTPHPGLSQSE